MADDEFSFDFENSLEPPQNNQQVSFDLVLYRPLCGTATQLPGQVSSVHPQEATRKKPRSKLTRICLSQNGAHIAPDLPPGAPIGQSIGNYKKNYRQVWQYLCGVGAMQANTGSASFCSLL